MKIDRNRARDRRSMGALRRDGWRVFVVWECQTKSHKLKVLKRRLRRYLGESTARNAGGVVR
jgi:DNA mismatch endonuclease (patch repair protein)